MARWLGTLVLGEDLGFVLSTHSEWPATTCHSSSGGSNAFFWLSQAPDMLIYGAHACTQDAHPYIYIKVNDYFKSLERLTKARFVQVPNSSWYTSSGSSRDFLE